MKRPERIEDYLEHIETAIDRITEYVQGKDGNDFQETQWLQDATIRNIEVIGEAASRIQQQAPEFVTAHPELPWNAMRGMRNRMIHNYFEVNADVVWNTVKDDLPLLKQQVGNLLIEYRHGLEPPVAHLPAQEKAFNESQDRQHEPDQDQGLEQKPGLRQK